MSADSRVAPDAAPRPRLRGVSHRYGCLASVGLAAAAVGSAPTPTARVGAAVYGTTMVGMFGASAWYHAVAHHGDRRARYLRIDHTAIFCFIAGTATPVLLLTSGGVLRIGLLALVWGIAVAGIVFEWLPAPAPRGYVTTVYLTMGWVGVVAAADVQRRAGSVCLALVVAGGVLYTAGALVHAARRPDPWPMVFGYHEVFHALVIAAVLVQWVAIVGYVLPLRG